MTLDPQEMSMISRLTADRDEALAQVRTFEGAALLREQALIDAACEEQREQDARHWEAFDSLPAPAHPSATPAAVIRSAPLTATPLADRLAKLEAALRETLVTLKRGCRTHSAPNDEHEIEAHYRIGKHGGERVPCELSSEAIAAIAAAEEALK